MQTLLVLIMCMVIVFLGFGLEPVHGYDQNNVYIQSIKISPSILKIGNTFTVTATLVNNSTIPIIIDGGTCSTNLADASFVTMLFDNHVIIKTENLNCAGAGVSQILNPGKNITQTSPGHGSDYIAAESGTANVTVSFSYHVVNQTDPGQPGFSQKLSKSLLFAISDNGAVPAKRDKVPSPLEQFKSGTKPEYVKCGQELYLIIKAEDGSYACVTIETGKHLAYRGWATTFNTGVSTSDYYTKCHDPYPQSYDGLAVLYMPTNYIGKICINYDNHNNVPTGVGIRIFEAGNLSKDASDVSSWASNGNTLQGNENTTKVYFIKTGNKTGLYGLSLTCGGIPLAVGYGANSTLVASDFPWVNQDFNCFSITYDYHIEGTDGIGVRYIPNPGMP